MGILEKLRPQPRWKHTDPAVRAAAVYEIGPDETETLHALAREDAEARVRRAAVTRVDAAGVLAEVARTDPDEDVRAEAVRGLAGLAAEADDLAHATGGRTTARRARQNERAHAGGSRQFQSTRPRRRRRPAERFRRRWRRSAGKGATVRRRLRALERLQDADEILNVALKAEHTDTAVAALERLTDASALTEVSQRARNKVAGRRARAKLRLMVEDGAPLGRRRNPDAPRRTGSARSTCCIARRDWSPSPTRTRPAVGWRPHASHGPSCRPTSSSTPRSCSSSRLPRTRSARRLPSVSRNARPKRNAPGRLRESRRIATRFARRSRASRERPEQTGSPSSRSSGTTCRRCRQSMPRR